MLHNHLAYYLGIFGGPKKDRLYEMKKASILGTFTTDTSGQLDVLGHDGDTLGVDGAQVGVLEQTDEVSLASLLKGHDSRALEAEISLEVLSNFTYQTLEWELADQEFSRFLVSTDLTESDSSGPVTMGFLDSPCGRSRLPCSLGGKLLTGSLSSGGFTCGLLSSGHFEM